METSQFFDLFEISELYPLVQSYLLVTILISKASILDPRIINPLL